MKKIILLALSAFLCGINPSYSQAVNEVSLVVSGVGVTKEEATSVALRSAVEQAFGTFVSANTAILNDELVKDEITTVSSGNIQKYTILSEILLPNGNLSMTIQATVSISKLVAYAQSKGSECEFAGATFGANLKLLELNKKNAQTAIENLFLQLQQMAPYVYDYKLDVSNPQANGDVVFSVKILSNENTKAFGDLIYSTLNAISLNESQATSILQMGIKLTPYHILKLSPPNNIDNYQITLWRLKHLNAETSYPVNYFYQPLDESIFRRVFEDALFKFKVEDNLGNNYDFSQEKINSIVEQGAYSPIGRTIPVNEYLSTLTIITDAPTRCVLSNIQHRFYPLNHVIKGVFQGVYICGKYDSSRGDLFILPFQCEAGKLLYTLDLSTNIPINKLTTISNFSISRKE